MASATFTTLNIYLCPSALQPYCSKSIQTGKIHIVTYSFFFLLISYKINTSFKFMTFYKTIKLIAHIYGRLRTHLIVHVFYIDFLSNIICVIHAEQIFCTII